MNEGNSYVARVADTLHFGSSIGAYLFRDFASVGCVRWGEGGILLNLRRDQNGNGEDPGTVYCQRGGASTPDHNGDQYRESVLTEMAIATGRGDVRIMMGLLFFTSLTRKDSQSLPERYNRDRQKVHAILEDRKETRE